jgi:hypothetical protein
VRAAPGEVLGDDVPLGDDLVDGPPEAGKAGYVMVLVCLKASGPVPMNIPPKNSGQSGAMSSSWASSLPEWTHSS